jgi:hypothetical protein
MIKRLSDIATTWPFFASVLLLLINDAWLKYAYPGLVSGKLSDFAGVAVVSMLLLTCLRQGQLVGYLVVGTVFLWWKSYLSQPVINAINEAVALSIGRTVDYSDLVALLIMPACSSVAANPAKYQVANPSIRRILLAPIVVLTTIGLTATSIVPPVRQDYQVRWPVGAIEPEFRRITTLIAEVARKHGLKCVECGSDAVVGRYEGKSVLLTYKLSDERVLSFHFEAPGNGVFGPNEIKKADRLRNDLKARLSSLYSNPEFVEQPGRSAAGTQ